MEKADIGLYAAERELLGCSHAQVAAYLFGLWGLPSTIVEAVAGNYHPAGSLSVKFSPLAAVHVAIADHDEKSRSRLRDRIPVDAAFWVGLVARNEKRRGATSSMKICNSREIRLREMRKRKAMAEKVLLVDDDYNILDGYRRSLSRDFLMEMAWGLSKR